MKKFHYSVSGAQKNVPSNPSERERERKKNQFPLYVAWLLRLKEKEEKKEAKMTFARILPFFSQEKKKGRRKIRYNTPLPPYIMASTQPETQHGFSPSFLLFLSSKTSFFFFLLCLVSRMTFDRRNCFITRKRRRKAQKTFFCCSPRGREKGGRRVVVKEEEEEESRKKESQ